MIKIKICDVALQGACSYYRGIGVLSKLRHLNPEIQVEYMPTVSWAALSDCDILFLMRPQHDNYIESMRLAQAMNIPVWVDYDDCLHEIPEDNPVHAGIKKGNDLKNMETALKEADIVTVSTQMIKDYYKNINPYIIVVENAFNDYNFKLEKRNNDRKFISWRGSATHRNDLLSCADDIIKAAYNNREWEWIFAGDHPWYITNGIQKSISTDPVGPVIFHKNIYALCPSLHIVPLIDSVFNRSKSNIAWIEATYAGAACLCPTLPEFQKPGAINYTYNNFGYLLEKMIKSRSFRQENYEKSLKFIQDNLLLSIINQKRIKIIEEVLA